MLVLALIFIVVVLLGMAALVVDVGYAYYAHRSLQSSADASALAGAQELPNSSMAVSVANSYGGQPGGKNAHGNIPGVTTTVTTKCIVSIPGCSPVNSVVVSERAARVPTIFAKLLGIDHFDIKAKATACSPCGVKPLDIMLVLDRTGSMCQDHNGNHDPLCTDLKNAKSGMKTFLGYMDPTMQWVGLAVLPPATSIGNLALPADGELQLDVVPLHGRSALAATSCSNGQLNNNSNLITTINCQSRGRPTPPMPTHSRRRRPSSIYTRPSRTLRDIIVFLSDGAANTGRPTTRPPLRTEGSRATRASGPPPRSRTRGTLIYSIGYDLNAAERRANKCNLL